MKAVGIIPARYKSSRFEGKPLALILGKPMILYVCEIVSKALGNENTFVATDDVRIFNCVTENGYNAVMTPDTCLTGTDRLFEAAKQIEADIYINIQGDEPMLNPNDIITIKNIKENNMEFIINGMAKLNDNEDPTDINIPKVLCNKNNELIYMSRLAIPGIKDISKGKPVYYKQVCIYAFTYKELEAYTLLNKKAYYENFEDIEILRFFDLGKRIKMVETTAVSLAVDNPEDIEKVEMALEMFNAK